MFTPIFYWQDDAADRVVGIIERMHGVVVHGANAATLAAAVDRLAAYDTGEESDDAVESIPSHPGERRYDVDGYVIVTHTGLGTIALYATDTTTYGSTCNACGDPIDYCQGHDEITSAMADVEQAYAAYLLDAALHDEYLGAVDTLANDIVDAVGVGHLAPAARYGYLPDFAWQYAESNALDGSREDVASAVTEALAPTLTPYLPS